MGSAYFFQISGHSEIGVLSGVLTVLFGAFFTALVALSTVDYLNEQNQRREWLREDTYALLGPTRAEIIADITALGRLHYASTEKLNQALSDPKSILMDTPLRTRLESLKDGLERYQREYQPSYDKAKASVESFVREAFHDRLIVHDVSGLAATLTLDWEKLVDENLEDLASPNVLEEFRRKYDAARAAVDPDAAYPSAEECLRFVKKSLMSEPNIAALRTSCRGLQSQAEDTLRRVENALRRPYGISEQ